MESHDLAALVEALLFVCDQPITVAALVKAVDDEIHGLEDRELAVMEAVEAARSAIADRQSLHPLFRRPAIPQGQGFGGRVRKTREL